MGSVAKGKLLRLISPVFEQLMPPPLDYEIKKVDGRTKRRQVIGLV